MFSCVCFYVCVAIESESRSDVKDVFYNRIMTDYIQYFFLLQLVCICVDRCVGIELDLLGNNKIHILQEKQESKETTFERQQTNIHMEQTRKEHAALSQRVSDII